VGFRGGGDKKKKGLSANEWRYTDDRSEDGKGGLKIPGVYLGILLLVWTRALEGREKQGVYAAPASSGYNPNREMVTLWGYEEPGRRCIAKENGRAVVQNDERLPG